MADSITRWEPFGEWPDLWSRLVGESGGGGRRSWVPAVDVVRGVDRIDVRADVPGITPDDISIEVENGVLTVSGEHEEETEEKKKQYVRRERRYGSFSRSMMLPEGVDPSAISASTKDGVLEVTVPLPKAEEPKKVTITPKTGD